MSIERLGQRTWLKYLLGIVISVLAACWVNAIPVPNQARVLATVIYQAKGVDANLYRVLMEVPRPAEVAIAQYQDQLENLGWQLPPFLQSGSIGFIPTFNLQDTQRAFCKADEKEHVTFYREKRDPCKLVPVLGA